MRVVHAFSRAPAPKNAKDIVGRIKGLVTNNQKIWIRFGVNFPFEKQSGRFS